MTSGRKTCCAWLLLLWAASAQRSCRNSLDRTNHQNSLWSDDLPFSGSGSPASLCDGTLSIKESGEICIEGRVTYQQLWEFLGNQAVYQPAARTVSVNGHLTAGSGNVVLGKTTRYLYDFVTSYKVNGVSYVADETIVDNLLAASRGTIDGLCLSPDIEQKEESWYQVGHQIYFLDGIDYDSLRTSPDVGLWFFGNFNSVVEYHRNADEPNFFIKFTSRLTMQFVNSVVYLFPSFLYGIFPVFAVTGTSRLLVQGKFSTKEFPNPLIAPDVLGSIEGVQIDTTWENLITAVESEGLFRQSKRVPLYFNVVIKRVEASGKNFKCWGEGTKVAAIDIEAPLGRADELDDYIENTIFPALSKNGRVAIHFGKRCPPNSSILQSALDVYESCGAQVGITVNQCYHPICERKATPSPFAYPEAYSG